MDILFADEDLEELCSTERIAKKALGAQGAKKLRVRLAELMAVGRVSELFSGRPHPLRGDRAGQFAVDLDGGRRLVFEPANHPLPTDADGALAWGQVTAIRIVYIGDYHD